MAVGSYRQRSFESGRRTVGAVRLPVADRLEGTSDQRDLARKVGRPSCGAVWVNQFNGNGWNTGDWTGWGQITGNVYPGAYSCALESSDTIVCGFINVQDSLFYEQTYTNGSWTGYNKVGGSPFTAGPSCATYASEKVMCVLVGLNNQGVSVTGP